MAVFGDLVCESRYIVDVDVKLGQNLDKEMLCAAQKHLQKNHTAADRMDAYAELLIGLFAQQGIVGFEQEKKVAIQFGSGARCLDLLKRNADGELEIAINLKSCLSTFSNSGHRFSDKLTEAFYLHERHPNAVLGSLMVMAEYEPKKAHMSCSTYAKRWLRDMTAVGNRQSVTDPLNNLESFCLYIMRNDPVDIYPFGQDIMTMVKQISTLYNERFVAAAALAQTTPFGT